MAERIVVTSVGIISALGLGSDAQVNALRASRSGLRHTQYLKTIYAPEIVVGEVASTDEELATAFGMSCNDMGLTRTTLLSMAAMENLLQQIDISLLRNESFAFINANTVGGMSSVENLYMHFLEADINPSDINYIDTLDCSESTKRIINHYNLNPFTATISTACSSSANALLMGARMIKQGLVKRAICGGCDALSRFTINGFNSLKNVSKTPCMPFDQNRLGLNLGEGGGYLLLESESSAKERGATVLAVLSGYSNTNDAYHPTAPSPDGSGAYRTMSNALAMAGLQPGDIGYINAHGTATLSNDAAEGQAIERLFGSNAPYYSSTKPFTGHTLAAAGSIEAIFSILAMQEEMALPNLNFETLMEEISIKPNTTVVENVSIRHVLSNSFGFGGSNVSLVFSKYE